MLFKNSSDSFYTPESTGRTQKLQRKARVDAVPKRRGTQGGERQNVTIELMAQWPWTVLDLSVGGWQHGTTPRNHSRTFQRADKKRAVQEHVRKQRRKNEFRDSVESFWLGMFKVSSSFQNYWAKGVNAPLLSHCSLKSSALSNVSHHSKRP